MHEGGAQRQGLALHLIRLSEHLRAAIAARSGAERVGAFSALLAAAGLLLYGVTYRDEALLPGGVVPWWAIVVLFAVAEVFVVHLQFRREHVSFSLSEIPLVLGMFFLAPWLLLPLRLLGSFAALKLHRRLPTIKLVWNLTAFSLEAGIALIVFRVVIDPDDPLSPRSWAAALAATLVTGFIGVLNVTGVVSLFEGAPQTAALVRRITAAVVGGLTNTILALVCVTLLATDGRGVWLIALLAGVLYVVYQSYAALLRRHESLSLLHGFTKQVGTAPDEAAGVRQLLAEARGVLKAEIAELTLLGSDGAAVRTRLVGEDAYETIDVTSDELASPHWNAMRTVGAPVHARAGHSTHPADLSGRGIDDALIAPLRSDGMVIGEILVGNRVNGVIDFDADDLHLFEALANHASVALENSRLLGRLRDEATATAHQAVHDALTGLPNRTLFHERVAAALGGADDRRGTVAVLLIDLDRFKEVNDTLGHHNGDLLLQHIARRLRQALRAGDTVARLGGDEFAVLLPDVASADAAVAMARALAQQLGRPVLLSDLTVEVGASIGIALAPRHGNDPDTLLQRADVAMYAAKAARSGVEVYEATSDQYSPERLALVGELRHALEARSGLEVAYQLKVDLAERAIVGVEALLRWEHPVRGQVSPDEFVPMAEHTGLIKPLTRFVLGEAVRQCATWRRGGYDLSVAVNLSMRDLLDPDLVGVVARLLDEHRLPATALTLELTEGVVMSDPTRMIVLLDVLASMGVQLAVDDFGTGYSSLAYLKRLPVHEIKIDKSFVIDLAEGASTSDAAIVRSVVDLGRNLGLRVVAEGVSDRVACDLLAEMGCEQAQGFWFARPVAVEAVDELLAAGVHGFDAVRLDAAVVPFVRRRRQAGLG